MRLGFGYDAIPMLHFSIQVNVSAHTFVTDQFVDNKGFRDKICGKYIFPRELLIGGYNVCSNAEICDSDIVDHSFTNICWEVR